MLVNVGVIMGSITDWETMKTCCEVLENFGVSYEKAIISAHRTPDQMLDYAQNAKQNGLKVIIAGAGGAAHLPGMVASKTTLPVVGVPIKTHALGGIDSLLSIVQMPTGVPVATMAIGQTGAKNAAVLAVQILAIDDEVLTKKLIDYKHSLQIEAQKSNQKLI